MRPRVDQLPGTCIDFYAVQNGLDVYKRQVYTTQYTASNGSDGFLTGEEAMTFWPTSMLRTYKAYGDEMNFTFVPIPAGRAEGAQAGGVQTSFSLMAVSYTHLDVYKRQVSTRLSRNAYRVPGSNFFVFRSRLTQIYLFCNSQTSRGDEIDVTPIFFSIHAGFRAF